MSSSIIYKGQTITTANGATRTLKTAGKYLEGDLTLVDVASSGGGPIIRGVIRPDAELVEKWTMDQHAVADMGLTIPAYTTTAQTLKATSNLDTYSGTPASYWYLVTIRTLTTPEYSITTKGKGRQDYVYCSAAYEWVYQASGEIRSLDGSDTYGVYSQMAPYAALVRYVYWSSATAITPYTSTAYGFYQTIQAPTITSNKTITIRTPVIGVRGHTTYFTSTYFNALTDARCQYVIELWRAPVESGKVGGWLHRSQFESIDDDIKNNNGTLR